MLPSDVRLISVDDHIIEHPNVWLDRLPAADHDRCPRVVELDNGRQAWAYEDERVSITRGIVRLRPEVEDPPPFRLVRFDEMRPGCYDPVARLDDMDLDGVSIQLGFPNFPRFAGHRFLLGNDKRLALACVEAYNDFVLDEWCAAAPDRYLGLAIVPLWDVDLAAAELGRAVAKGARALAFSENPAVLGLPSVHTTHWDPLFAVAQEAGIPVCMHIGSSSKMVSSSDEAPTSVQLALVGVNSMIAFSDWIFSGILERFPDLKVVLSEGGAGWVPYVLERATKVWEHQGTRSGAGRPPEETYRRQMYCCMVTDNFAIKSLDDIGVDNLLWESDYPHDDGMFPSSRTTLEAALAGVPDADARKIGEGNARRVFAIHDDADAARKPAPAAR